MTTVPAGWAEERDTHPAIARAIHEIATADRTPQQIWERPTEDEDLEISAALYGYLKRGEFPRTTDNTYSWGKSYLRVDRTK
jgi:hypothetical protein